MNRIPPYSLWLGHAGDGRDFRALFDAGVEAVVRLAAEVPPEATPRELICCRFPLLDGTGNRAELLSLAIHTVVALLRLRVPTLVCCGAGMSRSPAIAAAAMALIGGESAEESLKKLGKIHPIDVSPGLWKEVKEVQSAGR
jgi:protein-tyrosine phosphatase